MGFSRWLLFVRLTYIGSRPFEHSFCFFRLLTGGFNFALVRVELLLNRCLSFGGLTVRVGLKVKLHVAELAGANDGNVPDSLDDAKVALCHGYIVSHRAPSRQHTSFIPGRKLGMPYPEKCRERTWASVIIWPNEPTVRIL